MGELRVFSLFSGIGAFEKALSNIEIDYELIGFSEIDRYAIQSYQAIHNDGESLNYGDATRIIKKDIPDFDLLVGGSPCQSFSTAGKGEGLKDERGQLINEYFDTLREKRPKCFIYENVKGMLNHDEGYTLDWIIETFSEIGYRIDLGLLNSKFYKVPQNRNRIYIIGIREDFIENEEWEIHNDLLLDQAKKRLQELNIKTFNFNYPNLNTLNKKLIDILEDNVDNKYFMPLERSNAYISEWENKYLLNNTDKIPVKYDRKNGIGKTLEVSYALSASDRRGLNRNQQQTAVIDRDSNGIHRLRRLTPKECFRLQGFTDEEYFKCKQRGISDTQLYIQIGNSITVTVLEYIFKELFNGKLINNNEYINENIPYKKDE